MTSKRSRLAACTIGALTAGVLALSATPASASGSYSGLAYVYGGGVFADDWDNEGIVDTSHNKQSNATCLWQKILWADGELAASGIDGDFGSNTAAATARWQTKFQVPSDGSAGQKTWTAAGNWLRNSSWLAGRQHRGPLHRHQLLPRPHPRQRRLLPLHRRRRQRPHRGLQLPHLQLDTDRRPCASDTTALAHGKHAPRTVAPPRTCA